MEDIREYLASMIKPYQDIQKITGPILEIRKNLEKTLQPISELQKSLKAINKIYASIPAFENPILKHIESFKQIGEFLKGYRETTPKHLLLLAQYGWFIEMDSEISLPSTLSLKIQNNNIKDAEDILVEYYSSNINRIFSELTDGYPQRKKN